MQRRFRSILLAIPLLLALGLPAGLAVAAASDDPTAGPEEFGAGVTLEEATPLARVLAAPERFGGKPLLLRGRLTDVCQKKGCWTVRQDGEAVVRVRFRDYGFFVPKDSVGRVALVQGVAEVRELSEREARHIEAESRGGDPDAIEGPQREVGFLASGVRLLAAP